MNKNCISEVMWCSGGLGHISKWALYQSVCCTPLHQILRKKNVIIKSPGGEDSPQAVPTVSGKGAESLLVLCAVWRKSG